MERVAFLIEETGERIRCLLNPETIEIQRLAGVRRRSLARAPVQTKGRADDPVLITGGGSTEMTLHLLFDLAVEGTDVSSGDVRQLTRPLWMMSEGNAPVVRFIWGKAWNIPVVVAEAAERLEHFDMTGAPRRSWLTLRLLRVDESSERYGSGARNSAGSWRSSSQRRPPTPAELEDMMSRGAGAQMTALEPLPGDGSGRSGQRLDQVAVSQFGDPAYWRVLASANGIADPLDVPVGSTLRLPGGER